MLKKWCNLIFILSLVAGISIQQVYGLTYITKKGDTLSEVLYKNGFKPIYGAHGALKKTLTLNPDIRYQNGNKIFPGTKIVLSGNVESGHDVLKTAEEPGATTTVTAAREISEIFNQVFYWELSPSVSWKELKSRNSNSVQISNATALSDISYGATVLYGMRFNEELDIYSKIFLESVRLSNDNSINVVKKNVTTTHFNVGVFYKKKIQVEVGIGQELFLSIPDRSSVEIKKVSMPQLMASYQNEFYQFQEASLLYSLSGRVLLPGSGAGIDADLSYGAGGGIEAKLRNQSFMIGYEQTFLKSSGNSTDSQNIFWRYTWETP